MQAIWHYPKSVSEVLSLKHKYKHQAICVAGATSLGLRKNVRAKALLDLQHCGLATIKTTATKIQIGATTKICDVTPEIFTAPVGKFIAQHTNKIASTPLRHMISVGGNIAQILSWSELPVLFLATNATVIIRSKAKTRRLSINDWCKKGSKKALQDNEIITAIEIPILKQTCGFNYQQLKRTINDYSLLNVAAHVSGTKGKVSNISIAVGAYKPKPFLLDKLAKDLLKKDLNKTISKEYIEEALKGFEPPAPDMRVSKAYKKEMLIIHTQRAINGALDDFRKNGK